jgi:hypothetical protein
MDVTVEAVMRAVSARLAPSRQENPARCETTSGEKAQAGSLNFDV